MSSMVALTRGGRGLWALGAVVMLVAGVVACTTPATQDGATRDGELSSTEPGGLSDVWVERQGDTSVLTLVGLEDAVYTAFLHEDPSALVLDISSASLTSVETLRPVTS